MRKVISLVFCFALSFLQFTFAQTQSVEFNCLSDDCTIYVNNKKVGTSSSSNVNVEQNGFQQIKITNEHYMDTYYCLTNVDDKNVYPSKIFVQPKNYINIRPEEQCKLIFDSVMFVDSSFSNDYLHTIINTNIGINNSMLHIIDSDLRGKGNTKYDVKNVKTQVLNANEINTPAIITEVSKIIQKADYLDSVKSTNTYLLSISIKDYSFFELENNINNVGVQKYYKLKSSFIWKLKDSNGKVLDTFGDTQFSGDYIENNPEVLLQDAIKASFLNIITKYNFAKNIAYDKETERFNENIVISQGTNLVDSPENILEAVVTIRRTSELDNKPSYGEKDEFIEANNKKTNHASGFVVSQDGYILTNASIFETNEKYKIAEIEVILPNRTIVPAKVIHYNTDANIALIKVDTSFSTVMKVPHKTEYKNMQKVYTMGTPKAIELGATISTGIVSNTRTKDDLEYIQLNMQVNDGNGGGPVYNQDMELIGVLSSKLKGYSIEGICFCTPVHRIEEYLNITFK